MYNAFIDFVRQLYPNQDFIPLHEPRFLGNEKKYLEECIDTTFVSSVGQFVNQFEDSVAQYTGAKYAIATMNGTTALHMALLLSGVATGDEVITQPLTFVATCSAIKYCGAEPVFVDVCQDDAGMSPEALDLFLAEYAEIKSDYSVNKKTGKKFAAVVPMHTFGHPCKIDKIVEICKRYHIPVVEDAAESLGSFYQNKHTGTFAQLGVLSFNGNKVITTGGGGMLLTDDEQLAKKAKHLTTTAKIPHATEFIHDQLGYNYRLPNLNAALGCAQIENLPKFLENKRQVAQQYQAFFEGQERYNVILEPKDAHSNYWLNAIVCDSKITRDEFLKITNDNGVMTRPAWQLMHYLPMYQACLKGNVDNAEYLADRIVNIPSSVRLS